MLNHHLIITMVASVTLLPTLAAIQDIPDGIPSTPAAEPGLPAQYDVDQIFSWQEILLVVGGGVLLVALVAFAAGAYIRRHMR